MRVACLILVCLTACDSFGAEPTEVNLIVNGSFEEGPDVYGFVALDSGSEAIKGWMVTRGQIDYIGKHWVSATGQHSLDLHGSPGFGGVKQTIKTTAGQHYRVTFRMAGSPRTRNTVNALCLRTADKKEVFSFDVAGRTHNDMGWMLKFWEFVAVADETTLEFHTLDGDDDPSGVAGPALDDVRVVAVAEKKISRVPAKPADTEMAFLQGEWIASRVEALLEEVKDSKSMRITIQQDKLVMTGTGDKTENYILKLDATQNPKVMDLYQGDTLISRSIYEVEKDSLRLCFGLAHWNSDISGKERTFSKAGDRPTAFDSRQGLLFVMQKAKAK